VLLLDEPFAALDPRTRAEARRALKVAHAERNLTVLHVTHDFAEAAQLGDRVGIVDRGKMIALGTPKELIATLGGAEVVEFATSTNGVDEAALGKLPGVRAARHVADGWALTVDEVHVSIPALLDFLEKLGAPLTRLSTHHATLEDVFVSLTGRHLRDA